MFILKFVRNEKSNLFNDLLGNFSIKTAILNLNHDTLESA
jgi:hypothetical protein